MPEQEDIFEDIPDVVRATYRHESAIAGPFMDDVANDDGLEEYNDELRAICLLD